MTLVSGNIRFMRIFAGVPLGAGVKRHWGLSTMAIFGDLGGYVFENFRDTASNMELSFPGTKVLESESSSILYFIRTF